MFLLFAYHAATAQIKENWLSSPGGYLLLILLAVGSFAVTIGLFQQIGRSRKVRGKISAIKYQRSRIIDIHVRTAKPIVYQAGQYAFLKFIHDKEPHPFTMVSSGDDPHLLRFAIKALGDFTNDLKNHIKTEQNVTIEGPYREFKFEDDCDRQVWIAGGVGITPFLARLEYLSNRGEVNKPIDLWYCIQGALGYQFPSNLDELCSRCGINLYHQGIYLSEDKLKEVTGSFLNVSFWFCGPQKLLVCIKEILKRQNVNNNNLHYDSFTMR